MYPQSRPHTPSRYRKARRLLAPLFVALATTFAIASVSAPQLALAEDAEPAVVVETAVESAGDISEAPAENGDSDKSAFAATVSEGSAVVGDTSEQQAGQVSSSAEVTETKSSDAPAADPADEPAVNPAIDPTVDPTTDPATEPTADPAVDPAADPAVDPTKSGADAPADTPSDEQGSTTGQGASAEEEPTQKPTEEKTEAQTTATESEKDADDPAAAEAAGAKIAESIATQLKPVVKKLAAKVSATSTDPFVIVIDAGHGGFDSGAVGNGLQEHALNLSIAKHIQELLQGFANVVVYLTRTTNTSLKPDTKNDLVARVNFAVQHHADVFISVHTNSGPAAAHGIEVIAQNDSSYRYALHAESMGLATAVFNAERAIGLASHSGVYTRDYGSGAEGKYPDGSNADYLSLLRNCRINNIPAILIENLFISNPSDAAFLSSDANRQKIAQAIVNGIAKYYNLSKNLVSDSKGLRYLNDDKKTYAKNTFKTIGSNTYYFGDDTYAVKWEQNIGGKEYYFNGSYIMQTGVITFLKTGKVKLYGSDGAWVTTDGFSTVNGNTYYVKDSTPLRWEQRVGEKVYYFDGNYVMHTGWLTWNSDKTRSYFGVDGAAYSGWSDVDGKRYYFDSKNWNHGYRWEHWIEGKMYYFDGDCSMRTGWLTWNSDKTRSYFGGDGAAYTGWSDVGGKRYYFDSKNWCHGYRWERRIDDKVYYFDGSCAMHTGWLTWNSDKTRSYFGADGVAISGWLKDGSKRYYADPKTFRTVRWERWFDDKLYYFDYDTHMHTGWLTWNSDKSRSYFGSDGAAYSGLRAVGGKTYYFNPKNWNHTARWEQIIDGKMYYFDGDYAMHTGWLTWNSDKTRSYFGSDGVAYSGWRDIDGKRYYFDDKNWNHGYRWEHTVGDNFYYFDGSCAMHTGWLTWNSDKSRSYFNTDKSSDDYGAMLYGVQTIDGVPYDFGTSGKYYPQSIMGATQTTVAQMVRYYLANVGSSAYPTSVYTSKGAKTINDFCQILYEEAKAEGVRAEVLYAQVMLETGGLQFGRKVKAEQCNFGGIGATDTNPHPATFKNVREGLRAQTQHLKAYASTAPLNNACVDPRFNLVSRGSATTVYALAGKWASNTEYGKLLTSIMASLLKS